MEGGAPQVEERVGGGRAFVTAYTLESPAYRLVNDALRRAPADAAARAWDAACIEKLHTHVANGDAEAVRHGQPELPIELMVAFLYDQIQRGNPMGFFGMVQVLEGTSVAIALTVADQLKSGLGLPPQAMSYLSSHGALDQEHLKFFESLMNRVEDPADQAAIIHSAKVVYRLYGDMLHQLTGSCQ